MADDGSVQSQTTWPLVKFSFLVKFDGLEGLFQEVTGLNTEAQVVEFRAKSSPVFSTVKMPGIKRYANVTMKKGIFKDEDALAKLSNMKVIKRQTVIISLLDEAQQPVMTWTLANAFPTKITVTDMKADANEVAVETIEFAHQGLAIV